MKYSIVAQKKFDISLKKFSYLMLNKQLYNLIHRLHIKREYQSN